MTEELSTRTSGGKLIFHIFASEFERDLIKERTASGRKAAKLRGVRFGRKGKLSPQQIEHAKKLLEEGQRMKDVARLFKLDRSNLWRTLERASAKAA